MLVVIMVSFLDDDDTLYIALSLGVGGRARSTQVPGQAWGRWADSVHLAHVFVLTLTSHPHLTKKYIWQLCC